MQHAGGMLPPPVQKLVATLIAVPRNGDAPSPISSTIKNDSSERMGHFFMVWVTERYRTRTSNVTVQSLQRMELPSIDI